MFRLVQTLVITVYLYSVSENPPRHAVVPVTECILAARGAVGAQYYAVAKLVSGKMFRDSEEFLRTILHGDNMV